MGLLLAYHDSPHASARSPLGLVVQVYVATYFVLVLAGAASLWIAGAFHRAKDAGDDFAPEDRSGTPDPDPPILDGPSGRGDLRSDRKTTHAPIRARSASSIVGIPEDRDSHQEMIHPEGSGEVRIPRKAGGSHG